MCLTYNEKVYEKIRNKFIKNKGILRLWKVFEARDGGLYSPYITRYRWVPGYNFPDGSLLDSKGDWISEGVFHLFLKKSAAIYDRDYHGGDNFIVLPISCYLQDLVTAGYFDVDETVAMKRLFLPNSIFSSLEGK